MIGKETIFVFGKDRYDGTRGPYRLRCYYLDYDDPDGLQRAYDRIDLDSIDDDFQRDLEAGHKQALAEAIERGMEPVELSAIISGQTKFRCCPCC